MSCLFEVAEAEKLNLLSREDLVIYLRSYAASLNVAKKQIHDLQKENDRLKQELGYGETLVIDLQIASGS